jgi:hypothetical protein
MIGISEKCQQIRDFSLIPMLQLIRGKSNLV